MSLEGEAAQVRCRGMRRAPRGNFRDPNKLFISAVRKLDMGSAKRSKRKFPDPEVERAHHLVPVVKTIILEEASAMENFLKWVETGISHVSTKCEVNWDPQATAVITAGNLEAAKKMCDTIRKEIKSFQELMKSSLSNN